MPAPHPARRIALDPYVRRIRAEAARAARGGAPGAVRLRIGGRALGLDPWVLAALTEASPPAELVAEAVGAAAKTLHDAETLAGIDARDVHRRHALRAEILLDAALGEALLLEAQHRIDAFVREGRIDQAKNWSRLRQTIHDAAHVARGVLVGDELERARELALEFSPGPSPTAVPAPRPAAASASRAVHRSPSAPRNRPRPVPRPGAAARSARGPKPWSLALTVAAAGLCVAVLGTGPPRARGGPGVAPDLPHAERLDGLELRHRSAQAVVRPEAWEGLGADDRLEWVTAIGRVLGERGDAGFVLRLPSGRPVAQWHADRGGALLDARDTSPMHGVDAIGTAGRTRLH